MTQETESVEELDLTQFKGFSQSEWRTDIRVTVFPNDEDTWDDRANVVAADLGGGTVNIRELTAMAGNITDRQIADAHLIAAAPKLLALAKSQQETITRLSKALAESEREKAELKGWLARYNTASRPIIDLAKKLSRQALKGGEGCP